MLIPELANLAGDEQSGIVAAGREYPPKFVNRYGIDRARMTALFGDRLDEALALLANYGGDNAYAVRANSDISPFKINDLRAVRNSVAQNILQILMFLDAIWIQRFTGASESIVSDLLKPLRVDRAAPTAR